MKYPHTHKQDVKKADMQNKTEDDPPPLSCQSYQQMIGTIPQPMLITNLQGLIEFANPAASQLLCFSQEELCQMSMGQLIPECADTFRVFQSKHFSSSAEPLCLGKIQQEQKNSLQIARKDNPSRYIELTLSSFEATDGCFIIASMVDVNSYHLSQVELSRSNQELDQFAYVASHDLKAPLRGLDNLVTWVYEDIDDKEQVLDHVQMMRIRLHRMQTLLDDLLEYSRAGKMEHSFSQVDIHYMAQDLYIQSSPPPSFQLELGESFQPFETLASPLAQVMRNLINNAIKHNDKDVGIIKVSAAEKNEFIEITVQDNGPGIEAQYHQQIFVMFEKLQSKDDVEGSGMGLALVKKITTSLGGSITVQSTLGQGTSFCVHWPKHISTNQHSAGN
ncbi:MAG: hypothetical protein COB51_09270 [Moraxellaceae bacterium]|nr:MAG: hypothetical protein COB51_09270 [Moraxellaceae bacterium]